MAEAAVERRPQRFFCHQCTVEISPSLPDFTCPRCQSGFIEEVTGGDLAEDTDNNAPFSVDPVTPFDIWERAFSDSFQIQTNEDYSPRINEELDNRLVEDSESRPRIQTPQLGQPRPRHIRRFPSRHDGNQAIEGIISHLLSTLAQGAFLQTEGLPVGSFQLHGNPGDYAWGADGLDAIVSQLLNQLEGTGAPPAEKGQIDALPHKSISKEQVDARLQCTVCMEDFRLSESVRCLPCQHYYHTDCIVPWLERHGTCPICRKDLNGRDTSEEEPHPLQANFQAQFLH